MVGIANIMTGREHAMDRYCYHSCRCHAQQHWAEWDGLQREPSQQDRCPRYGGDQPSIRNVSAIQGQYLRLAQYDLLLTCLRSLVFPCPRRSTTSDMVIGRTTRSGRRTHLCFSRSFRMYLSLLMHSSAALSSKFVLKALPR